MSQQDTILQAILDWSQTRPMWLRDALRRIVVNASVSPEDIKELVTLNKAAHGLSDGIATPLEEKDVAISEGTAKTVRLKKLTHHKGANALAEEQSIEFGDHLTVVFGENAVGKSGYTRILKRACRSRAREDVLGNVLDSGTPLALDATISFKEDDSELAEWKSNGPEVRALANVSVFDSHSAPVYLRDKTDVAFRPFGLDVFDKLSAVCSSVKNLLEQERSQLLLATSSVPIVPEKTKVRALLDTLSAYTKPEAVAALGELSDEDQKQLELLRQQEKDLKAADPAALVQELKLKSARFESLTQHLKRLLVAYGPESIDSLRKVLDARQAARLAADTLQKTALSGDVLPGTGGEQWRHLWAAAESFRASHSDKSAKEIFAEGEPCPLCQQVIGASAAAVLGHLREYITSNIQDSLAKAEADCSAAFSKTLVDIEMQGVDAILQEVMTSDPSLADQVKLVLQDASVVKVGIEQAQHAEQPLPNSNLSDSVVVAMEAAREAVVERINTLGAQKSGMAPEAIQELNELEARVILSQHLAPVHAEIERKRRIRQYDDCIGDTSTLTITKKSTELTEKAVTEQLKAAFKKELDLLKFTHTPVEIRPAGGAKGTVYHQVVFSNAPGVAVSKVLSEGESRTLSLAAFLAELSTSSTSSSILFDDPVSSLDHRWRERIALRLVHESKNRQVIVFTHDILFLKNLRNQAQDQAVAVTYQHVSRGGQIGMTSSEVPWVAMSLNERLGKVKMLVQGATKVFNTQGQHAYESEAEKIYGWLREAWEQGVTEVLLNDVVERYRHSIETNKLRKVVDITEDDFKAVETGMSKCSRWMIGHDKPAADGSPFPEPKELMSDVETLETWAKAIRTRRNKK